MTDNQYKLQGASHLEPDTKYKLVPIVLAIPETVSESDIADGLNEMLRAAASEDIFVADYTLHGLKNLQIKTTTSQPEEGELFGDHTICVKEIDKILSVSTGNITEEDTQLLAKEDVFSVGVYEEGFFIYTKGTPRNANSYSDAFHGIVSLGRKLDCRFINFDRDADCMPGLPEFDW